MKLLLDENISPRIGTILCEEDGIDACGVRDRGHLSASDHAVLELAFREDRIFVTLNVDDFVKLARSRELHAGIVLLEEGSLPREEQLAAIRAAIRAIEQHGDMTNKLLWVSGDGSTRFAEVPCL